VRDLAAVTQQDRARIELLVLASVFVVLVLLLRRVVVPVYLLLSVLFNYYTTLGVSFAFFWLLDPHGFTGIDWKGAIFLFTILIAVGEDYNIFLMTRVHEEQRRHGLLRGITVALDRTGPIISSCGLIMAGTFASLLAGSLTEMKQLGFALGFGVLLDTFVVRPILVPAFLILLRSGRLHLPGWTGRGPTSPTETQPPRARAG
jgi:RND superfamily putative drug exporter